MYVNDYFCDWYEIWENFDSLTFFDTKEERDFIIQDYESLRWQSLKYIPFEYRENNLTYYWIERVPINFNSGWSTQSLNTSYQDSSQ